MKRLLLCMLVVFAALAIAHGEMARIEVDLGKRGFRFAGTERAFVPWGFNYDRDYKSRLIEDYWHKEWETVAGDFREMKALGANVVRVHLQFGRFMQSVTEPDETNLRQLARLLALAEETGLYLDVTGLGCYHKADVPPWYDALDEAGRWHAQVRFWEAVAGVCAKSPAVFCYDLMNEPVVAAGRGDQWLGPEFAGKHYVQYITRDPAGRARADIGRQWVETLAAAIRKKDPQHLITVGLVDWSLDRPGLTSGMVPAKVAPVLDFVCVHLYPRTGKHDEDLATLAAFAEVGKPVVIEETFPLFCTGDEFSKFMSASTKHASGWIGFYWGQTIEELDPKKPVDAFTKGWLEIFKKGPPGR
jgi:hypothetical protein